MIQAAIHGLLLALGLILPLGTQNIFIFNQGANHARFRRVIPVIITAGLCDTMLILLAVIGISLILLTLPILQLIIYLTGLIFLIYMAWTLWRASPQNVEISHQSFSPRKQISFALSVSLLNPHAIMDTIGVIGTSASAYFGSEKVAFTIATISVSWLWFIFLAILGHSVGQIDKSGKLVLLLNKLSSIFILVVSFIIITKIWHILF
ncbi:LysE family transporter [Staphylococcus sp. NRL 16/872]|uniref:LysE/ArgO family amino acid transporter n=1 Tax=Staphylococcus sp. NRL 16/872 TaxID=2930131 RepID=UPI001FB499D6|nr:MULTISPECIES: LysE family transporter [unclassified Staphylococcus]MCJ1656852.1 LysE family transporter [Staphylococcus sp. NRL 21/187]MCJ1662601.1 LysE family transporter [Staphylococcus sp. NRL 18/288]MCJ1668701.1 LysE family transporter [Staphylococcus sp. NRL 19/737]WEN68918.1 LysE family transporter [Staphylococcus sp. NRL 16/872]